MKERFYHLWSRLGALNSPDKAFEYLSKSYCQPHRFYHNLDHIKNCLDELEEVRHLAINPDRMEFALWYHDAVYGIRVKDNEEQSAMEAHNTCVEAGLSKEFAQEVRTLILATKHTDQPITMNQKLIIDIDLSILGKPVDEFDAYETNIRKEYKDIPENQFRKGRITILKTFLSKPTIYYTDYFKSKYQNTAVMNLQRSIDRLGK